MTLDAEPRWRTLLLAVLLAVPLLGGLYAGEIGDAVRLNQVLESPSGAYWMGTDELGRDVFSRILRGTSLSLGLSLLAWMTALIGGMVVGTVAGYYAGSVTDRLLSWIIALAYATPFVILLVGLLGVIGPGLGNAYLVLALFAWVAPARQTRAAVRNIRDAQFVVAARSFGYPPGRLFRRIIMPAVYRPALAASLAILPEIVALDAGLSFFGLGAQPPTPSLGKMIVDGVNYLSIAWWMTLFPLAVLATICLVIRLIAGTVARGDHLWFQAN